MSRFVMLSVFVMSVLLVIVSHAQQMPFVYDFENTGSAFPIPYMRTMDELPVIPSLPDPFEWSDGSGRIKNFSDWRYRRAEIKAEIEHYEIGVKPDRPENITASYSNGKLTVVISVDGRTLTLISNVILPEGEGPFPAVIGVNSPSGSMPAEIFSSRNIARITFSHDQVTTYGGPSTSDPYYRLYPDLNPDNTGQYSAWAWGVSRLIDGLELVQDVLPIDTKHLAVTGCSYAGKLALFAGAFDERIALTISQESGGGGYTTWRYSDVINRTESVETLGKTDYNWFKNSMSQFANSVNKLPHDHHELMAMVAPRALFVTGNPGWVWLADESGHVGSNAAKEVWNALGVPDRFGYSLVGGHNHCAVPEDQTPEIEAFVEKFLLGNDTVNTNVATSPYNTNLTPWITWSIPELSDDTTYFTTLDFPADNETGLDNSITFKWNKVSGAEKYYIQISTDPKFVSIEISDSTTADTSITFNDLSESTIYYWRVNVKSGGSLGHWSKIQTFVTTIALPDAPQLVSSESNQEGYVTLKWNKVKHAEKYTYQIARAPSFNGIFKTGSPIDSTVEISWFTEGVKNYWRVRAENMIGKGDWSDTGEFSLIYTPLNLVLELSESNKIILRWNDKSSIEDGYVIERMQNGQSNFSVLDTLKGSGNEFTDINVEIGQTYSYRVKAYTTENESEYSNVATLTLVDVEDGSDLPKEFSLSQNYPNPFNPSTKIKYAVPVIDNNNPSSQNNHVTLKVFDLLGREVAVLVNEQKPAGIHEVEFRADNLSSGLFFYTLKAGNFTETKKMILLR